MKEAMRGQSVRVALVGLAQCRGVVSCITFFQAGWRRAGMRSNCSSRPCPYRQQLFHLVRWLAMSGPLSV